MRCRYYFCVRRSKTVFCQGVGVSQNPMENLSPQGDKPINEGQARELVPIGTKPQRLAHNRFMRRKSNPSLTVFKNVRPGGNRARHAHTLAPMLAAPAHLSAEAKQVYEGVRTIIPSGLLSEIDSTMLAVFATHTVIHRRAMRELAALTVTTKSTVRPHPLVAIADGQAKLLIALADSLCLSPGTRQKIRLPDPVDDAWANVPNGA